MMASCMEKTQNIPAIIVRDYFRDSKGKIVNVKYSSTRYPIFQTQASRVRTSQIRPVQIRKTRIWLTHVWQTDHN